MTKSGASRSSGYPGQRVPNRLPNARMPVVQSRRVRNPQTAFALLRKRADSLAVRDGGGFRKHRYTRKNSGGGRARIHFQGIQRSRTGPFLFLSGGDMLEPSAQLFVVKLASRPENGPWGSNIRFEQYPEATDSLVGMYSLAKELWHAGGISLMGDVLAVPIENDTQSEIRFYDVSDPTAPTLFNNAINRDAKATAVALCRLDNHRYLCGVWFNEDKVDFYLSRSSHFQDGFPRSPVRWDWHDLNLKEPRNYQAVNFLRSESGDLFMVGTERAARTVPGNPYMGFDRADLFRVTIDRRTLLHSLRRPQLVKPTLTHLQTARLEDGGKYCNFGAGGGVYVDDKKRLILYGAFHWRGWQGGFLDSLAFWKTRKYEVRFGEFSQQLVGAPRRVSSIADARIDMFAEANYQGRRLSIHGELDSSIEEFNRIWIGGRRFGRRVSSLRYQLPKKYVYRLFASERFNSNGDMQPFDLRGTGDIVQIADLRREWRHDVRSARFV